MHVHRGIHVPVFAVTSVIRKDVVSVIHEILIIVFMSPGNITNTVNIWTAIKTISHAVLTLYYYGGKYYHKIIIMTM